MRGRYCSFIMETGKHCQSPPLHDSEFCLMHSPEHAQEVNEARRLGGLRRRREVTLSGAYDFESLDTIAGIRRIIEVTIMDTLGMENSIARNRTLAYLAMVALRTMEVGEQEERIAMLEQAVRGKQEHQLVLFDIEPPLLESGGKDTL